MWESSLDGIVSMNAEGNIVDLNPAAEQMFGISRKESIGRSVAGLIIPPNLQDQHREGLARYLATGEPTILNRRIELSACRRDGTVFPVELTVVAVRESKEPLFLGTIRDITAQREAATKLAASQRQLSLLLNSVGEGIHGLDPQGRILFGNYQAEAILGYGHSELVGRISHQVLHHHHPDGSEYSLEDCPIHQTLQDGITRSITDEVFFRKDGSMVPVQYVVSPMLDGEGGIKGAVVNFRDISEQQRRDRLRAWEAKILEMVSTDAPLDEVLHAITVGLEEVLPNAITSVILLNEDGQTMRVGAAPHLPPAYSQIVDGLPVGPRVGSCGTALYRRETVIVSNIATDPLWAHCRTFPLEHGLLACWSTPVLNKEGEPLATFAVYYREPRSPNEEEFELVERTCHLVGIALEHDRKESALQESEAQFRLISRVTNDIIWEWDIGRNLLTWNEGLEALIGCRPEAIATVEAWEMQIHPDDRERVTATMFAAMQQGDETCSFEYRFLRSDGHYAYVLDRGYIIRDGNGKPIRMLGGITDLSERKELETQLLHSQKMDAVGQLAGSVAHDFNNILTIILGYSELLLESLPSGSAEQSMLSEIHEASERAKNLTLQLLAFSRKQVLDFQVVDLNGVVSKLENLLRRLIRENIHLQFELAPQIAQVRVDPGQLEQVIINLAVNAQDAMPQKGTLKIRTDLITLAKEQAESFLDGVPGTYVELTITDTGSGIPPEVRERIFEPFFTTKAPGKGTGLGLATVFGIVKQCGGLIQVDTEVGKGTCFRVLLRAESEPPSEEAPSNTPARRGTETILLVEDETGVRKIARQSLEGLGYHVIEARNGREALEVVAEYARPIHLIVTDVVMPEMSGGEMVAQLRDREINTKVLFISGYTDDEVLRDVLTKAEQHFLPKPFTPQNLARKVRQILES